MDTAQDIEVTASVRRTLTEAKDTHKDVDRNCKLIIGTACLVVFSLLGSCWHTVMHFKIHDANIKTHITTECD